ncbi:LamG domain-containing protein [Glycomyces terrestris]|uniref:LamG domain-containing protein n=1 Tax=Glycomyces terrestris TaxID=2493553 RepID=A0A426V1W0_9ACTN|nr:LamG domain-containing protein [Glycomyces terrestris]
MGCRALQSGAPGGGLFKGTISTVRLWRGALTTAEAAAEYGGNPAADLLGHWTLNSRRLTDSEGANHLTIHGDTKWGFNRANLANSALEFNRAGWATTPDAVVRTDQSFSIAAWVKVDANPTNGTHSTILSQGGVNRVGFNLNYTVDAAGGHFLFAMPSADTAADVTWSAFTTKQTYALGEWYYVAVVVDIPGGTIRMFVNGSEVASLQNPTGTVAPPANPWNAEGPLYVGVHGRELGLVQHLDGAVDQIQVWQSTVDPYQFSKVYRPL